MTIRNILFAAIAVILLSGCGPMYKTTYTYRALDTKQGRICASQCTRTKSMCQRFCASEQSSCQMRSKKEAQRAYDSYVSQRKSTDSPVNKTVGDFRLSEGCAKSCGCETEYRSCFEMCGGRSVPRRVCIANCDKAK